MADRSNFGWLALRAETKNSIQRETDLGIVKVSANARVKTGVTFLNVRNPDGSYCRIVLGPTGDMLAYTRSESRVDAREALVTMGVLAS